MSDLELFFVVPGDSPASRRMFGVKAAQNTSVSELKKLVYAELRDELDGIGARNLVLWKVPPLHLFCRRNVLNFFFFFFFFRNY